jgi:hypothetical protein
MKTFSLQSSVLALASAIGFLLVPATSAAADSASDHRSSTCNDAEAGRRSEARADFAASVDSSGNRVTNGSAAMYATNYMCSSPHTQFAFRAGSTMQATVILSTTDRISDCTVTGGGEITIKGPASGSGSFTCKLNAGRNWGQIGWQGSVAGKSTYKYSLYGFKSSYQGTGTVEARTVVTAKGPNGVASIAAHATLNVR